MRTIEGTEGTIEGTIEERMHALDAVVVDSIDGKPITRGELNHVFNIVTVGMTNWKNPITRTLTAGEIAREGLSDALVRKAIVFFTGSVPRFERVKGGVKVTAAGYYRAIGS